MPPAIIGGAIAGVGALGASVVGSKASGKAVNAQTAAAEQQSRVQQQIYQQNAAALAPYQNAGLPATQQINAMLGLPQPAQAPMSQMQAPGQAGPGMDAQVARLLSLGGDSTGRAMNAFAAANPNMPADQKLQQLMALADNSERGKFNSWLAQSASMAPPTPAATVPVSSAPVTNPGEGFGKYLQNSDYGFQFANGSNAVNSGYAGAGTLQSGAAMQALEKYRQNLQQGYRGEYMGALGNQQAMGLSAASAQAGVGQNYANSMSNVFQNKADAISNGALVQSQNTNALISGLTNIGASYFGSRK